MVLSIIILSGCFIYFVAKIRKIIFMNKFKRYIFVKSYLLISNTLIKKWYKVSRTMKPLTEHLVDAMISNAILDMDFKEEKAKMEKDSKKYFDKLYKDYKKFGNLEKFINDKYSYLAQFFTYYGMKDFNIMKELENQVA